MRKFHIIIIKFSIFTHKNSQSDTFFPKLKNTMVKIDIKSFFAWKYIYNNSTIFREVTDLLDNPRTVHVSRINVLETSASN